jgi:hypothetical protein
MHWNNDNESEPEQGSDDGERRQERKNPAQADPDLEESFKRGTHEGDEKPDDHRR